MAEDPHWVVPSHRALQCRPRLRHFAAFVYGVCGPASVILAAVDVQTSVEVVGGNWVISDASGRRLLSSWIQSAMPSVDLYRNCSRNNWRMHS